MNNKELIINEFNKRLDIIYTIYHNGQYHNDINAMVEDLEKKYKCKIEHNFFAIEKIKFL